MKKINGMKWFLSPFFFQMISDKIDEIMENMEERFHYMETRIASLIISMAMILLGGILLVFSITSYLQEFAELSKSFSYFIVGAGIIIIGVLLKKW